MSQELYIGIMSGTSLDGIDTALVEIEGTNIRLIAALELPIPTNLKQRILNISLGQPTSIMEIGKIDHELGLLYAEASLALLKQSHYRKEQITAIGNHGQTVFHQPNSDTPFSIQLGDANIIATQTGIKTIADFRRQDIALGGQGAPLVPAFHQSIFPSDASSTLVLNIGGIANISVLAPNKEVIGYDTGPGNMLMDAWCKKHKALPYDRDAHFALEGTVNQALLQELLLEPYLKAHPPKSTGRELFNLPWLENILSHHGLIPVEDVQCTLCEFTAVTISREVRQYSFGSNPRLLVCGGGVKNPMLLSRMQELLENWEVVPTDNYGVDSQYMEAMAFAWLAYCRIHNLPSNLPKVTGASRSVSLGVLYLAN
ncbi:anhydro-N-acetylmuramic acid kinase [Vibrio ostreicida]|uniref:anhydro-N-acetylmuramic acid kinase n=1 Tax=Vibrio ostreicida TaxID=526588 RepID=UPI000970A754|nr:anhydro-N-acetylmuramic acid kinase [Vibrio ostreicida]